MRYAHNVERVLALPPQSVALLAVLFLRGPQTAGELRINSERLHRFGDISRSRRFLNELAERASGALVAELPRAPGTRETRWMQLLTGPASMEAAEASIGSVADARAVVSADTSALAQEVAALRAEVASLREEVAALSRSRSVG